MCTEGDAYMEQLTNLIISDHELDTITDALKKLMSDTSATSVMLLDKSGQVISSLGMSTKRNATSLGALLAGAFSSSRHIAELLGEKDFRTIFQQGVHENIYTTMVDEQWLLVIVFDKLTHIGLVKVLSKKTSEEPEILCSQYSISLLGGGYHRPALPRLGVSCSWRSSILLPTRYTVRSSTTALDTVVKQPTCNTCSGALIPPSVVRC
jgi:predicted regulator of Ras-like GTPase activity (Roadblock/LC7/MglB family)